MEELKKFPNVYLDGRGRFTHYFVKTKLNKSFFEEKIVSVKGELFKEVDPERSKLFASIAKDISQLGLKENSKILYLGASHGYTVSFLSDVVCNGEIYALDFAPRVVRDLVFLCEAKSNIAPILDDACHPENYNKIVPKVDIVFMDIVQKNQIKIFLDNCDMYLNEGGFGILALKARSVDVTRNPRDIFKITRSQLEQVMSVVDYRELEPFEKDHALFVCKRKSAAKISFDMIKATNLNFADPEKRRNNDFKRSGNSDFKSGGRSGGFRSSSSSNSSSSSSYSKRKRY